MEAAEKIKAKRRLEAEKERIANRERTEKARIAILKKAEKDRQWSDYISQFKKYNKAQKRSELEWFKNKLANNFANTQYEKELYIHELEMIMLGDEK